MSFCLLRGFCASSVGLYIIIKSMQRNFKTTNGLSMSPQVMLNKYLKSLIFYPFFFPASKCVSFLKKREN